VQSARKGIIQFKLSSVTRPVTSVRADILALDAMRRILAADSECISCWLFYRDYFCWYL